MSAARAWVLNLDAELELEGRAAPARVRAAVEDARATLAELLPPGDVVLDRDPESAARGLMGRAWCPTPSALARLARAGARVPDAPPLDVLRRVNERGFAFELFHLPGARRCEREDEVRAALARPGRWRLSRGLAFAGRGHRMVDGGEASEADLAFARKALRAGALYIQPRVDIVLEAALHGLLARSGALELGRPTIQIVEGGAWRRSRPALPGELREEERATLAEQAKRAADELHRDGYFGPFGVDAFRYRADAEERFCPLSELNARYTMAWGAGMGGFR